MPLAIELILGLIGLFVLDRLLLRLERAGYIYYRRLKPKGSGAGNALAEFQAMLTPGTQHVIVAKKEQKTEHTDDGGPPDDDWRRFHRD